MTLDLYGLMPAIHRRRDEEGSGALRALFDTLQAQHDLLHGDIGGLYDDWFAETCEPWLLPYIGELVAAGRLGRRLHPGLNTRALVADTLADRRRKGLGSTLQRVVSRATGWPAQVIEPDARLLRAPVVGGATVGPGPSLAAAAAQARLGDPLERVRRTPSVRTGARDAGSVEVRLWRLQSAALRGVDAASEADHPERRRLHPLGLDAPLFHGPSDLGDDVSGGGFPRPVTRGALAQSLRSDRMPLVLRLDGAPLRPHEIAMADLSSWRPPPAARTRVALDPERGRVLLLGRQDYAKSLDADLGYGFVDDLGGGAYPRPASPSPADRRRFGGWAEGEGVSSLASHDLAAGISAWSRAGREGVLRLDRSGTLRPPTGTESWSVRLDGGRLAVVAASGERPCLDGGLEVYAGATGGVLILDGLMLGGVLRLHGPATVVLRHCTLWPGARQPAVLLEPHAAGAELHLDACLAGDVVAHAADVHLDVRRSVLGGVKPRDGARIRLHAAASTFDGPVEAAELEAVDCLVLQRLEVTDVSAGEVRHCWLGAPVRTPRAHACLTPDGGRSPGLRSAPRPRFVSRRRGQPGYMQLRPLQGELDTAASDGQAPGAFHGVGDALRRDNLADALTEHLPFHLRAAITYAC